MPNKYEGAQGMNLQCVNCSSLET